MTYVRVAPNARDFFLLAHLATVVDCLYNRLMTIAACTFSDLTIAFCNSQRVRITTGGEIERVPESVTGLRRILPDQVVRSMTVVASRRSVTAALPGCEVLAHDVAIGARSRIIGEVRRSLRVTEGEGAETCGESDYDGSCNEQMLSGQAHRSCRKKPQLYLRLITCLR